MNRRGEIIEVEISSKSEVLISYRLGLIPIPLYSLLYLSKLSSCLLPQVKTAKHFSNLSSETRAPLSSTYLFAPACRCQGLT